jgi:PAS domain-containing protein
MFALLIPFAIISGYFSPFILSDIILQDGDSTTPLTKAYNKIESYLFTMFSLCSFDFNQWNLTFYLCWLIMTLQFCHFISNTYIYFGWSSGVATVFLAVVDFVSEFPFFTPMGAYTFSSVIIGTMTILAFLVVWLRYLPLIYTMRYALLWITSVFYFPIIIPHLKMIFGCFSEISENPYFPNSQCWSASYIGYFFISLILACIFFTLAVTSTLVFYNAAVPAAFQVRDNPINNRSTNRPEYYLLILKTICLVLYTANAGSSWRYALSTVLLFTGIYTVYSNYTYMPWWDSSSQALYLFQAMLITWIGTICLLTTATSDSEGTGMLFFAFLPIVLVASIMLQRRRMVEISQLQEHEITASYLIDLKVKYYIHAYCAYMRGLGDIYIEMTPEHMAKRMDVIDKANKILEFGVKRFPDACELRSLTSLIYTTVLYNRVMSYREIKAAANLHPRFDLRFRLRMLQTVLNRATRKEQSTDVANYLEFKQNRELVDISANEATRYLVKFWTELLEPQPDIDTLASIGQSAREALSRTLGYIDRLLQLNPNSIPVLQLSGMIYLELTGEVQRAVANFERADQIESEKKRISLEFDYSEFLQCMQHNLDIFDDDNGVITISVNTESIGIIESVNPALLRMFGYTRESDLIGKSVNVLIPEPISSQHDSLITSYMSSRKGHMLNTTRMIFGLHHLQYLVGLSMHVRWNDESMGKMIGVLHPIANTYEVCVFLNENNRIIHSTQNLHSVFGFSKRDILAGVIKLDHLMPVLDDADSDMAEAAELQLYSKIGMKCQSQHAITQQKVRFHINHYEITGNMHKITYSYISTLFPLLYSSTSTASPPSSPSTPTSSPSSASSSPSSSPSPPSTTTSSP